MEEIDGNPEMYHMNPENVVPAEYLKANIRHFSTQKK